MSKDFSKVVIAIDGPAGAGKSTVSKALARELELSYLDTGAMYRSLALKASRAELAPSDEVGVAELMESTTIEFGHGDPQPVFLDGEEVTALIRRSVKQRKDSIEQFEKGGRPELAEKERSELVILEAFLPQQMSKEDIQKFVESKIAGQVLDKAKLGQFIGQIMKDLKGKADGTLVKAVVESLVK